MNDAISVTVTLDSTSCGVCGFIFAVPSDVLAGWRQKGTTFYCPRGCGSLVFSASENKKLKAQLERTIAENVNLRGQRDREERRRIALKGQLTKVKNRVANGVCPCCNRTFVNLGRHMQGQHPEWKDQEVGS